MADMPFDADEQPMGVADSETAATVSADSEQAVATETPESGGVSADEQPGVRTGDDIGDLEQYAPPADAPEEVKALYQNVNAFRAKVTQESQAVAEQKRQLGEWARWQEYAETEPEVAAQMLESVVGRLRGQQQQSPEPADQTPPTVGGIPWDEMTATEQALATEVISLRQQVQGVSQQATATILQATMDEIVASNPELTPDDVAATAVHIRNEILQNPTSPNLLRWAAEIRQGRSGRKQAAQADLARQTTAETVRRQTAMTSPGAGTARTEPQLTGKMPFEQIWAIEAAKHGVSEPW